MSIVSWLLDLLYPPKCVVCRRLLTGKGPVCPRCMDALPEFDGAAPAVRFTSGGAVSFFYEGQLRESFLRFKFGGSAFYAQTYGAWMAHTIRDKLAGKYDVLTWRRSAGRESANAAMTSRRFCAARLEYISDSNPCRRSGKSRIRPHSPRSRMQLRGGRMSPERTGPNGRSALPENVF